MTPDDINRRKFVRNTGLGALAFNVGGIPSLLTPREACANGIEFKVLANDDAALLAAFADHLLPGAGAAGVAHFVDHQLGTDPQECLLMCKYFPQIKAPFATFYSSGIAALRAQALAEFAKPFAALATTQKNELTDLIWRGEVTGWNGPPPPLFYMMVRSDAVDVVYGTKEGFDQLNIPYMAHIMPTEKW
ncbi:MAG: hypothetical protein ACI915_001006 [Gammaproteobacteria bacterium]|jgi:hypothetical protein